MRLEHVIPDAIGITGLQPRCVHAPVFEQIRYHPVQPLYFPQNAADVALEHRILASAKAKELRRRGETEQRIPKLVRDTGDDGSGGLELFPMLHAAEVSRVLDGDGRVISNRGKLTLGTREDGTRIDVLGEHDHGTDEPGGREHRRGELLTARCAMHEDATGRQRLEPMLADALLERLTFGVVSDRMRNAKSSRALIGNGERDRFRAHRLPHAARKLLRQSFQLELEDAHGVPIRVSR